MKENDRKAEKLESGGKGEKTSSIKSEKEKKEKVVDDDVWDDLEPSALTREASDGLSPTLMREESEESKKEDTWDDITEDIVPRDGRLLEEQTSPALKKRVQQDLEEVALIGQFLSTAPTFGGWKNTIEVRMGLPIRNLGLHIEQCRAWALDPDRILTVHISFPHSYFNSPTHKIIVNVGQVYALSDKLEGFRLSWTLERAIKKDFWKTLPEKLITPDYKPEVVKEVMEIADVPFLVAHEALRICKNDQHNAVNYLSDKTKKQKLFDSLGEEKKVEKKTTSTKITKEMRQLMDMFACTAGAASLALQSEPRVDDAAMLLSNDTTLAELEKLAAAMEAPEAPVISVSQRKDAKLCELLAAHNFLVRIMLFVKTRLMSCNQDCMICGQKIQFPGMKPSICGGALCKMGYEDLGMAFDLGAEINQNPEIVDLLISIAVASTACNRMHFVTPVDVTVSQDGKDYSFVKAGTTNELDTDRLTAALSACPSVTAMRGMAQRGVLLQTLQSRDPLLYPLLRWIIISNRAHLRLLQKEERIKGIETDFQFVLLSSTPENEAKYQGLKRAAESQRGKGKGSVYAFHGSSTGNWHSILRTGLKNMSGTKYMDHGAAHGNGIYMATDSSTSLGYCKQQSGWDQSMFGKSITLLALCEVVNHVGLKPPNPYYVVPEEAWVTTRFVFVFGSTVGYASKSVSIASLDGLIPDLMIGVGGATPLTSSTSTSSSTSSSSSSSSSSSKSKSILHSPWSKKKTKT